MIRNVSLEQITAARRAALEHPQLTRNAKALFVWLLENALRSGGPAAATLNEMAFALGVSPKSVLAARLELLEHGLVWESTRCFRFGRWLTSVYHINRAGPHLAKKIRLCLPESKTEPEVRAIPPGAKCQSAPEWVNRFDCWQRPGRRTPG
jgi:hypothetical protein